jgi:hypothetical protein
LVDATFVDGAPPTLKQLISVHSIYSVLGVNTSTNCARVGADAATFRTCLTNAIIHGPATKVDEDNLYFMCTMEELKAAHEEYTAQSPSAPGTPRATSKIVLPMTMVRVFQEKIYIMVSQCTRARIMMHVLSQGRYS